MHASLTDLFATDHDPMAVLNLDGRIALASSGFTRVLGHDPADLIGTSAVALFHRADRDHAAQLIGRIAREAGPLVLEGRVRHARSGYRWFQWSLRKSPDGTIYLLGRDESVRRQIEAAVRRRERFNRAMLDHAADSLLVLDDDLVVVDANATAAAVLGATRDSLKGRHLAELAPTLAPDGLRGLRDGEGLTVETLLQDHRGGLIDVEVRIEAFEFDDAPMIVAVARDIRERKAQAEALVQLNGALELARDAANEANIAKTAFLTQMSHALRTPLGAILGYSEMLHDDAPEGLRRDLTRVLQAAAHLQELVDDVLDLARVEAGRVELEPEDFPIAELLEQVRDTLGPHLGERELTVDDQAGGMLHADRSRVLQALLNVVQHAIRRSDGAIELSVRDREERVAFEVEDTGPLWDEQSIERAFEPFGTAGQDREAGSGLGLPLARRIARQLGGRVHALPGRPALCLTLPRRSGLRGTRDPSAYSSR